MIEIKREFNLIKANLTLALVSLIIILGTFYTRISEDMRQIEELETELFSKHAEIQELKQALHMIEMRNEGIEYIDELQE